MVDSFWDYPKPVTQAYWGPNENSTHQIDDNFNYMPCQIQLNLIVFEIPHGGNMMSETSLGQ